MMEPVQVFESGVHEKPNLPKAFH